MRFGLRNRQRGATFLGTVLIVAILGLGLYAGIRLVPLYMEHFAIMRALNQAASSLSGGEINQNAVRSALDRRWTVEDIRVIDVKDVETVKTPTGVSLKVDYEARAPFVANISIVVDFNDSVPISGQGAIGL